MFRNLFRKGKIEKSRRVNEIGIHDSIRNGSLITRVYIIPI